MVVAGVAGCASSPGLVVETEPSPAMVTVTRPAPRGGDTGKLIAEGPSPLVVPYRGEGRPVSVLVEPLPLEADRYQPRQFMLDAAMFGGLPTTQAPTERGEPTTAKRLTVQLDDRRFVSVPHVDLVLTPTGEWQGLVQPGRATKELGEADGSVPALIVDLGRNPGIAGMTLSPSAEKLVYAEARYGGDWMERAKADEVVLLDPRAVNLRAVPVRGGGGVQHLTSEDYLDLDPAYTASGEELLFASNRRRSELLDLLRIKAAGRSGISNIYVTPRRGMAIHPSQARDGTIAFELVTLDEATGEPREHQVWTMGGPSQYPTQVTRGRQPAISPDGRRIAFIGEDGNLWVTSLDGSNQTQLTFDAAAIRRRFADTRSPTQQRRQDRLDARGLGAITPYADPAWSDDAKQILYTSMEGSDATGRPNEDIWIVMADGSSREQLTTNGSIDRQPIMSSDMTAIYFLSNRGGRWGVRRIPAPLL